MSLSLDLHRSHTCGALRLEQQDAAVTLAGWAATWRDHGGLIFIDLRDRYGRTQLVFDAAIAPDAYAVARNLHRESVLLVKGVVRDRGVNRNPKLPTGDIEVAVHELHVLSESDPLPFELVDEPNASEEMRLKNRVLDLRRAPLQRILITRHRLNQLTRRYLDEHDFLELETPFLGRSTPEGARDFLVPSRVHKGEFFALPQSPQLFKQMFMLAGFDRYFQIVKCFRDEDLRNDRQPEFTQIDLEMSFPDEEDIIALVEGLLVKLWGEIQGVTLTPPFPRITFADAMLRCGHDAPDLRFDLFIHELTPFFAGTTFGIVASAMEKGGVVRGLCVPGGASFSRKDLDGYGAFVQARENGGAGGLLWGKVAEDGALSGSLAKAVPEGQRAALYAELSAKPGDLLLVAADKELTVCASLCKLRLKLAQDLKLIEPGKLAFVWVVDFPLLEWNEEEGRWSARHHAFTSPKPEHWDLLETDPGAVLARAYDIVLNGSEIGGGSIRIHRQDLQQRAFKAIGIGPEEAQAKFGYLLDAFRYGAPPHGGLALGMDRLTMLMTGANSIRDVIPYPKTTKAACLLTEAPSAVDDKQLKELGLAVTVPQTEEPKA